MCECGSPVFFVRGSGGLRLHWAAVWRGGESRGVQILRLQSLRERLISCESALGRLCTRVQSLIHTSARETEGAWGRRERKGEELRADERLLGGCQYTSRAEASQLPPPLLLYQRCSSFPAMPAGGEERGATPPRGWQVGRPPSRVCAAGCGCQPPLTWPVP